MPYIRPNPIYAPSVVDSASHMRYGSPSAARSPSQQVTYTSTNSVSSNSHISSRSNGHTVVHNLCPPEPSYGYGYARPTSLLPLGSANSPPHLGSSFPGYNGHSERLRQSHGALNMPNYVANRSQTHHSSPPSTNVSNKASSPEKALFTPPFSPPPTHWRALIAVDPEHLPNEVFVPLINRLPVELLSAIFTRCMDDQRNELIRAGLRLRNTPLLLTRVCSFWRQVAMDLPALWQQLALRPCQGRAHHYRIARLFIERSKDQGIHIHYNEDFRRGDRPVERCPCAIDLILQNIGRIKTLELREIRRFAAVRLARVHPGAAASMCRFSLVMREENLPFNVAQTLSRLYCSPNLRRLWWDCTAFPKDTPWSQMVTLHLTQCIVDCESLFRIVASAPYLQELVMHLEEIPASSQHPALRHHTLTSLSVAGIGPQDNLLRLLHLPNLRHLSLRPLLDDAPEQGGWPFSNPSALYKFIGRLTAGLESIVLQSSGILDDFALLHVIRLPQMSGLRKLHVVSEVKIAGDTLFMELQPGHIGRTVPLLPHLEILRLECCATSDGVISRMLTTRYKQAYPLRLVSLGYPDHHRIPHPLDENVFDYLKKVGMSVDWEVCISD